MADEQKRARRSRLWVGTSQCPEEDQHHDEDYYSQWASDIATDVKSECEWYCGQFERGEQGRAHLQFTVYFTNAVGMRHVKELCGGIWPQPPHLEIAKGNAESNKRYCSKDDGRLGVGAEVGIMPRQGKRKDLEEIYHRLRHDGEGIRSVADGFAGQYMRYSRSFEKARDFHEAKAKERFGILLYGESGTGKSRNAGHIIGEREFYDKCLHKWWDGYDGEEVVIWDDFDWEGERLREFLRLFDWRPARIQKKGATCQINTTMFVFTSNETIDTWWPEASEAHRRALERRFKFIVNIQDGDVARFEKGTEEDWLECGLLKLFSF